MALGAEKDDFINYLAKFVKYKKTSKSGSGSYSLVAGVSSDGKVTQCMMLSEFAEAFHLEKTLEYNHEINFSGSSFEM